MKTYQCHKRVQATEIVGTDPERGNVFFSIGSDGVAMKNIPELFARKAPSVGDYLVTYDDGYTSWSPKAAFEAGYTLV
jgi:hypothetical protein